MRIIVITLFLEYGLCKAVDAPWDVLDQAYFNGYALWTYPTTPFHFTMPGFAVEEINPWRAEDELWRGLRVTYPSNIASHSREQDFYFGPDFLLRRHDYHVEASGGFAAAQYVFDFVAAEGITLPTKRRAYLGQPGGNALPPLSLRHNGGHDVIRSDSQERVEGPAGQLANGCGLRRLW